jgi:hypothetical protein
MQTCLPAYVAPFYGFFLAKYYILLQEEVHRIQEIAIINMGFPFPFHWFKYLVWHGISSRNIKLKNMKYRTHVTRLEIHKVYVL